MVVEDLAQWLRAQLDTDAEKVRAATPGPWVWTAETAVWDQCGPTLIREGTDAPDAELVEVAAGWGHDAWGMHISEADRAHIAEWDPARVLREIDAKRLIVEVHHAKLIEAINADGDERSGHFCFECDDPFPCRTLRLLALPYADKPGYREEWAP